MYAYDYVTPTRPRVIGGPGAIDRLPEVLDKLGLKKLLIVTSPSFVKSAIAAEVQKTLGTRVVGIFSEVSQHSPLPVVKKATEAAAAAKCDAVISLGGGSAVDTAKGVLWYLAPEATTAPIPHIALPSTLSGAEFTHTSGITVDGVKRLHAHKRIIPHTVILDPRLAAEMPKKLMQGSLLNAMDHCLEGIMSINRSPMTDATCQHAMRLLNQAGQNFGSAEAMSDAQAGAALAVMDTSELLVGLAHAFAHVIGGRCRTPHGFTHGLVAAPVMRYNFSVVAAQQRMIAQAFGINTEDLSDEKAAGKAIVAVQDLVRRMDAPKGLRELGVPEADLPILADLVMEDHYAHTNPRKVTPKEALEVLKWAWTGDIPPPTSADR